MRSPPVTQESVRIHPCLIAPVLTILLNLPLRDGVSAHTKATTGSLVFRAVAADIRELRTILRSNALPVIFTWEQTHAVGFEPRRTWYHFLLDVLFVILSFLRFEARATDAQGFSLSVGLLAFCIISGAGIQLSHLFL